MAFRFAEILLESVKAGCCILKCRNCMYFGPTSLYTEFHYFMCLVYMSCLVQGNWPTFYHVVEILACFMLLQSRITFTKVLFAVN